MVGCTFIPARDEGGGVIMERRGDMFGWDIRDLYTNDDWGYCERKVLDDTP